MLFFPGTDGFMAFFHPLQLLALPGIVPAAGQVLKAAAGVRRGIRKRPGELLRCGLGLRS